MNVTRRGFGGTVIGAAAALLLPKLQIRPQYDLHAIAKDWCDAEASLRYDLGSPYVMQDHIYATDGRGMIRFADDWMVTNGTARIPEVTVATWNRYWDDGGKWIDLPNRLHLVGELEHCPSCIRKRNVCTACDGVGEWVTLPGDRSEKCGTCNGLGVMPNKSCQWCGGDAERKVPSVVLLGGNTIGIEYYELISKLPGVRLHPSGNMERPLMFASDIGIQGLMMQRIWRS